MAPGRRKSAPVAAPSPDKAWNVGDLVLAKIRGSRAWPAKVSTPETHKIDPKPSKVFVEYFGTKELGFVQRKEVSEFTPAARAVILDKAMKSGQKSYKAAVMEICDYFDKCKNRLRECCDAAEELAGAVLNGHHRQALSSDSHEDGDGAIAGVSSGGDTMDRGEVVDEQEVVTNQEEDAPPVDDPLDSFARTACLVLDKMTADRSLLEDVQNGKETKVVQEEDEDAIDRSEKVEGIQDEVDRSQRENAVGKDDGDTSGGNAVDEREDAAGKVDDDRENAADAEQGLVAVREDADDERENAVDVEEDAAEKVDERGSAADVERDREDLAGKVDDEREDAAGAERDLGDEREDVSAGKMDDERENAAGAVRDLGDQREDVAAGKVDDERENAAGAVRDLGDEREAAAAGNMDDEREHAAGAVRDLGDEREAAAAGKVDDERENAAGSVRDLGDEREAAAAGKVDDERENAAGAEQGFGAKPDDSTKAQERETGKVDDEDDAGAERVDGLQREVQIHTPKQEETLPATIEIMQDREVGKDTESDPDPGVSNVEAKPLKTFERRRRRINKPDDHRPEKKQDTERDFKNKKPSDNVSKKAKAQNDTAKKTEKLEKKLLKKSKADVSDGKNSKTEKVRRPDADCRRKGGSDEDDVKKRDKHRDRSDETLPPSKRQKFLRMESAQDGDSSDKKAQARTIQTKKSFSLRAKEPLDFSPVSATPKLFEDDTNRVRVAYEAAKEIKQKLAQKDETSSASMKLFRAATQAKERTHASSTTSNRVSPLFMRPSAEKFHRASPSRHRIDAAEKILPKNSDSDKLERFRGMLDTLTRSKESISKATRFAMECANKGLGRKVMDVIMRKLKNEGDHKKRVDVLFLVDSLTQYYHQKGTSGRGYAHIVESCLDRFLSAVAPPNSPSENRQQCFKVISLWLKRDIMQESLLKDTMAKLEAGLNTTQRQYQRQDRAIDDPLRGMDDMLVDEYGSNTSFQLPGLLVRPIDEDDDPRREVVGAAAAVAAVAAARVPVLMEDLDGELEMEDVSPRASRDNSSSSSLTRHEDDDYRRPAAPLPPSSSPPPLPPSPPPPGSPFRRR